MKKLLGNISYSFNNFYDSLNVQGQMVFSIIVLLIIVLLILLFITYIYQNIKNKKRITRIKENTKFVSKSDNETSKKEIIVKEEKVSENTAEIMDIANKIDKAINDGNAPVSLTNFEEDQERTAIISIDELMLKAKELEIIDDENAGVNYLEKYNIEPSEVEEMVNKTTNNKSGEVKAFKVSQVISPIYGIKKEIDEEEGRSY